MVPDVGARLTWLGKEGSVPEPLAVQTCPIHLQVSQQRAGAAWEGRVPQATQSDTAPRECPWEEEAAPAGNGACCEPGAAAGWHQTTPEYLPGAGAGGSWQVRKGTVMSPALPICCLAKASADLPHTALQALSGIPARVRHPSHCQSGIPACVRHPSQLFPIRRSTRDPL